MKYVIVKTEVCTADGKIKTAWNIEDEDGNIVDCFNLKRDAVYLVKKWTK